MVAHNTFRPPVALMHALAHLFVDENMQLSKQFLTFVTPTSFLPRISLLPTTNKCALQRISTCHAARFSRSVIFCAIKDASAPSFIILDKEIRVRSSLPSDKNGEVLVSLKAEDLGGRRRRISGVLHVEASVSRLWKVLTAYDKMQSFMPNILQSSSQIRAGVLYLDQIGLISRKLALKSRMLLRVTEDAIDSTITFSRVEGRDFTEFEGVYFVKNVDDQVFVGYELVAKPFPLFPMWLVERKIVKEVPKMLASIREEAIAGRHVPFK